MRREDDYKTRRAHLAAMDDDDLHRHFWRLAEQIVDPLLKLGYENTTPAVERSVLLRMGFSSLEVKPIVDGAVERGLLGHGAGHIVFRLAREKGMEIRAAGLALSKGEYWEDAEALFKGDT